MSVKHGFCAANIIEEGRVARSDVEELRTWSKGQELPRLTDEQLVLFVLCCDDLDASKTTITNYYSLRRSSPELFDARTITREDLQGQLDVVELSVFPKRTPDGNAIMFHRLYDTYYSRYKMSPSMKLFFMTLDTAVYDDPPSGLIVLFDMKGVGLRHLTSIRLHLIKIFFQYLQEAVPVRVKAVHVLNSVYFIDKIITIIRPFIDADLFKLVQFHASSLQMEYFYDKCIPSECLPEELGGGLPSVRVLHQENAEKLTRMQDYFDAEELQRHATPD